MTYNQQEKGKLMSYVEKYKVKFKKEEQKKEDDGFCLNLTSEQAWKFECAVRDEIKTMRDRCLEKALGTKHDSR